MSASHVEMMALITEHCLQTNGLLGFGLWGYSGNLKLYKTVLLDQVHDHLDCKRRGYA